MRGLSSSWFWDNKADVCAAPAEIPGLRPHQSLILLSSKMLSPAFPCTPFTCAYLSCRCPCPATVFRTRISRSGYSLSIGSREPPAQSRAWGVFGCVCRPRAEPSTSPLGPSLADYWDHPSDAESGAIEPSSERHSGPPSAAHHPPAPDQRPGPDHCHGHREPDPASNQHPGHHALTHQARPAGNGPTSRQPWLPGPPSLPLIFCLVSVHKE